MATTRPRERILAAATRLFADEGVNATSVDRVIAEADVAPMTLYRHFGGKDVLVAATVERWSVRWLAWLRDESGPDGGDAAVRLEGLWDALEKWFADEGFRGSYVDNVATELRARPGHPAQAAVAAHRAGLRELLSPSPPAPPRPRRPPCGSRCCSTGPRRSPSSTASRAPRPAPGPWPPPCSPARPRR